MVGVGRRRYWNLRDGDFVRFSVSSGKMMENSVVCR